MGAGTVETADHGDKSWEIVQAGLFDYPVKKRHKAALWASQCSKCGKVFFPKRSYCRYCLDEGHITDVTLARRGVIYASTMVYVDAPSGIRAPYSFGYVDIPENGVRIFALFDSCERELLVPGREVKLVIGPIGKTAEKEIIGYKFRPV